MSLRYVKNPEIEAKELAALRIAVGWDARQEKIEQLIGRTYMTVACLDSERLVGFVDVISDGVDDAFIRNLLVHPDYRRRGIALKLLKTVIEKVKNDRIKTINVLFEPELINLYSKAGFKLISGGIIDNENEAERF